MVARRKSPNDTVQGHGGIEPSLVDWANTLLTTQQQGLNTIANTRFEV